MESLLLVWLIVNTLLLIVGLAGGFVLWRDRDGQKSLYRSQLKAHIQQLEQLEQIMRHIKRLEEKQEEEQNWLILLTEQLNGLIELFRRIETTAGGVGNGLKTAKMLLEIVQSKQSTLIKLAEATRLIASAK